MIFLLQKSLHVRVEELYIKVGFYFLIFVQSIVCLFVAMTKVADGCQPPLHLFPVGVTRPSL